MFKRIERVNALIRLQLGQLFLKEIEFPFNVLVSISRVECSSNLIQAKVYISVMPENKFPEVFKILNKNIYFLQKKLNKLLKMRPVPKIEFKEEKGIREVNEIEKILEKLKKDYNPPTTSEVSVEGRRVEGGSESQPSAESLKDS